MLHTFCNATSHRRDALVAKEIYSLVMEGEVVFPTPEEVANTLDPECIVAHMSNYMQKPRRPAKAGADFQSEAMYNVCVYQTQDFSIP